MAAGLNKPKSTEQKKQQRAKESITVWSVSGDSDQTAMHIQNVSLEFLSSYGTI